HRCGFAAGPPPRPPRFPLRLTPERAHFSDGLFKKPCAPAALNANRSSQEGSAPQMLRADFDAMAADLLFPGGRAGPCRAGRDTGGASMRQRVEKGILAIAAMAMAMAVAATPAGAAAKKATVHYRVVRLDTLGGTAGGGLSINNRGWVAGGSNLPGDQTAHAALWRRGETVDLGTLGGPNSAVSWPVKSENGLLVGISETTDDQPLGEIFSCRAFFGTPASGKVCRGFAWRDDAMTEMPTLGGDNSYATGANDGGEVVGWAENAIHDGTCTL